MNKALTIAETTQYQRKAEKHLLPDEQKAIIDYLALHPESGRLIQGTGGIRKLRWGKSGTGKSGGVRIIYYYYNCNIPLFLLTLFSKTEKANISRSERNDLKKLTYALQEQYGE